MPRASGSGMRSNSSTEARAPRVSCPIADIVVISRCADGNEEARYVASLSGDPGGAHLLRRVCQGGTERASRSLRDARSGHRVPDGRSERLQRQRRVWHPPQPVQRFAERHRFGETIAPMACHREELCGGRREHEAFRIIPGESAAVRPNTQGRFLQMHLPCRRTDLRQQAFGTRLLPERQTATDLLKTLAVHLVRPGRRMPGGDV